jgi:NAD(P)-dependent dehydrogenase (short-subunit alcohol dehydrogenase family)
MSDSNTQVPLTFLVTGASSGIGKEITISLLKRGYRVYGVARSTAELKILENEYSTFCGVTLNFADLEAIPSIAEGLRPLDGIVFCHGPNGLAPAHLISLSRLREIHDVHLTSIVMCCQHLLLKKLVKKCASIVFISSISAHAGTRGMTLYCSAKSGLDGYMRALSDELGKKKIRCNSIAPYVVKTKIHGEDLSWMDEKYQIPLGIGEPADVADLTLFLLSDQSSYITGQSIKMTGLSKYFV